MRSRHYIEEIKVAAIERPVPTPVSVVIMAFVTVAAILLIQRANVLKPAADQSAPAQVTHH